MQMNQSTKSFRMSVETNCLTKQEKLFEQFVILGLPGGEPTLFLKNSNGLHLQLVVKDVYPQDTNNRGYLNNLHMWSFRENINIYDENGRAIDKANVDDHLIHSNKNLNTNNSMEGHARNKNIEQNASLQNFIITDEQGQRRYCTSLQIYELRRARLRETDQVRVYYVPKSYCILSSQNCFEVHRQILAFLLKSVLHPMVQGSYENSVIFTDKQINTFEKYAHNYGFREAQKMPLSQQSDNPRDNSNNSELLNTLRVKEEFILSFLLSQLETFPERKQHFSTKQLTMKLDSKDIFSFRYSPKSPSAYFQLDNFSYKPLLSKLSIPSIVEFLQAILLEKQIIVFSKDPSDVAHLCEAIFTFIKPLQWRCVYIPSLPNSMLDTLDIIVPYIIGVQRSMKDQVLATISSENKLFLDLDTDFIIQDGMEIPAELKNNLKEQLKEQMKIYKEVYKDKNNQSYHSSSEREKQSASFARLILNVKKVFLHFMISLINNFAVFFLFPADFDYQRNTDNETFDFKAYFRFLGPSFSPFYVDFASKTMTFRGLIEDSYKMVRQMEVFGKDIQEAGQHEGAGDELIQFMLEIKKAVAFMRLEEQSTVDVCNVNLYRYGELLATLHLEHNVIIANYLQELSKPQVIETKGELLKYLIFSQKNSHCPFIYAHEIPRKGIALESIEYAPIVNLEEIQNQADKTISAKSEKSKSYYPTELRGGPRMGLQGQLDLEEMSSGIAIPKMIKQQLSMKKNQHQIQESCPNDLIIPFPQQSRTILQSSKAFLNMRSTGQLLQESSLSPDNQYFSRDIRTFSLNNNVSSKEFTSKIGKSYNINNYVSPHSMSRDLIPLASAPSVAAHGYFYEEKKKRKIFQSTNFKPRESGYGLNTTKNETSEDEEFYRSRGSDWRGQMVEGLRGEDQDDLPNRSDIPEENVVETVPDFFRGELEMKNIVALNIDQITSCHTFRVKPTQGIKQPNELSNFKTCTLPTENDRLQEIKNHFFFTESCSPIINDLEETKTNMNCQKTPFSVAGPGLMNESWRLPSDMINSSANFFRTEGDDQLPQIQQTSTKLEYLFNTQSTFNEDRQSSNQGMLSPSNLNYSQKLSHPIQQKTSIVQSSLPWAQKKCDFFHTENVQEEEETESVITEPNVAPKTAAGVVTASAVGSISLKPSKTGVEKNNLRIKDDPLHLKEYFSYGNTSQIKQQSQPLSFRKNNHNNTFSNSSSNNQNSSVISPQIGIINQNKKGEDARLKKRSILSSNNNGFQTQPQSLCQNQNSKKSLYTTTSVSTAANSIATMEQSKLNSKLKMLKIFPDEIQSSTMYQQNQQPSASFKTNFKSIVDVYSRNIPKTAKISLCNPLRESTSFNIISHQRKNSKDLPGNLRSPSKQIVNNTMNPYNTSNSKRRSLDSGQIPQQFKPSRSSLDSEVLKQNEIKTEQVFEKSSITTKFMSFSNPNFFKLKGNSQKPAILNKENSVLHLKKIF